MLHEVEFKKYGIEPFVPSDLTPKQITSLLKALSIARSSKTLRPGLRLSSRAIIEQRAAFSGRPLFLFVDR